jgi:hypothetical protein
MIANPKSVPLANSDRGRQLLPISFSAPRTSKNMSSRTPITFNWPQKDAIYGKLRH